MVIESEKLIQMAFENPSGFDKKLRQRLLKLGQYDPTIHHYLTYWKNGIQVGDLLYQTNETGVEYNLMNGRLNLEDSNLFNLDSKLIINSPIEINNLFDGKISPQTLAVGRVKIKIF